MSITSVFNSARSGLRVAQAGMEVVAQNVSSADAPGYTRKRSTVDTRIIGDQVVGVRLSTSQRALDAMLQRQLRTEFAGGMYADQRAAMLSRLDGLYGPPDSDNAITAVYSRFLQGLQALATSPESDLARSRFMTDAGVLAARVSGLSDDIQGLRLEAEQALDDAVGRLNGALGRLADVNLKVIAESANGNEPGNLLDQRDAIVDEISRLVDINVAVAPDNSLRLFTRSGLLLFDRTAVDLRFDTRGAVGPGDVYDPDPNIRRVGTITMQDVSGGTRDLIAQGVFRSGEIASYLQLRDRDLVEAQRALDEFADQLARSLSEREVVRVTDFTSAQNVATATTRVATGPITDGFAVSIPNQGGGYDPLQNGDTITVDLVVGGTARRVTILRNDASVPATPGLPATTTADPNDQVIGVPWGGSMAAFAANVDTALAAIGAGAITVSAAGPPQRLAITGDGTVANRVTGVEARITAATVLEGEAALPLFIDGGRMPNLYSASISGLQQKVGISQRLRVNPDVLGDGSALVRLSGSTPPGAGDPTRPNAMVERLTRRVNLISPVGDIGTAGSPASATVSLFLQRIVVGVGQQSENAARLAEGQKVVVTSLEARFTTSTRVDVDQEMARLIELQHAFQASARVITAADEMFRTLFGIGG